MHRSRTLAALLMLSFPFAKASDPQGQQLALGEVNTNLTCIQEPDKRYALFLPSSYRPDRQWPVILFFDPSARAEFPLRRFAAAAERYGFIMACSYQTQNYVAWETNWSYALAMWKDVLTRVSIDPRRMYAGGFSGGARLASRIAIFSQKIAGVICCGAGFWTRTKKGLETPFDVVATIGDKDMNYLEMADLEQELDEIEVANRRLLFDGGHQWPPSETCDQALAWLHLRAFQRGLIEKDAANLEEQWQDRLNEAKTADITGRWQQAARNYRHLVQDFKDLQNLEEVEKRLAELENDAGLKEILAQEATAENLERSHRTQMIYKMKTGEELEASDINGFHRELAWWKEELDQLQQAYGNAQNEPQRTAILRLFDFLGKVIYEKSVYTFREKEFGGAILLNSVAGMLVPKMPYAFFNLAKAYTQTGQTEKALDAIKEYIAAGGPVPGQLQLDPMLWPLHGNEAFKALVKPKK